MDSAETAGVRFERWRRTWLTAEECRDHSPFFRDAVFRHLEISPGAASDLAALPAGARASLIPRLHQLDNETEQWNNQVRLDRGGVWTTPRHVIWEARPALTGTPDDPGATPGEFSVRLRRGENGMTAERRIVIDGVDWRPAPTVRSASAVTAAQLRAAMRARSSGAARTTVGAHLRRRQPPDARWARTV
ncbi:hypothetical protein [Marinactinospora rubrisoli]|uniref:Uncharacterized protein n=1 Tax=Marinactinospora rubrisoli TaxID=2715399 RepID=A0ABW2KG38_9ACTN